MASGMTSIRMHRDDNAMDLTLNSVQPNVAETLRQLDPESAARRYVDAVLGSGPNTIARAPTMNELAAEYKVLGIDRIPFLDHQYVKFRQYFHKIPVYGSLVTVELDKSNEFVSINTSVGDPSNVDPLSSISPKQIIGTLAQRLDVQESAINQPARQFFYYDAILKRWRLTYIVEDVTVGAPVMGAHSEDGNLPKVSDFVFDAHTGDFIAELPRTQTMASVDQSASAADALGLPRNISFVFDDTTNVNTLYDRARRIRTHDFNFRDAWLSRANLPGSLAATGPAQSWDANAISAHANAQEVADFLRDVLQRDGLDGVGGEIVSSINCVYRTPHGVKEWRNAARFLGQMIYGQRLVNGSLRSYAVALDIVAHELLHGLTENTARLEYRLETGALNESFSDIFGIVVANRGKDITEWNWEIGASLSDTGTPIRDMQDPTEFDQPDHMNAYKALPDTEAGDHGGVHTNSGIHNKAAFLIFTAQSPEGDLLFTADEVARLYYITLAAQLSRTSGFADCRAGVLLAAQSLFGSEPNSSVKVGAIGAAYDSVGILDPGLIA